MVNFEGEKESAQDMSGGAEPVYDVDADWVIDGGVHWRHLANTTELSVSGGNAALCQITLTTCYFC